MNKLLTVHIIVYNEQKILPFVITWWRWRFGGDCKIVIHDNHSTDNSLAIALHYGCDIKQFNTNNTFNDLKHMEIKNTCYREDDTPMVAVVDCDEVVAIDGKQLQEELEKGTTIISTTGYNMVGINSEDIKDIKYGVKNQRYSKSVIFHKNKVKPNFDPGSHTISPKGTTIFSVNSYKLLHYKFLSPEYVIERYKMYEERFDEYNRSIGHGIHYQNSEEKIREEFLQMQQKAIKILE